ncbi:MAG: glucokinase [Candidatus Electrothrix sp. ATG2]|nr:glucokinase [Candidatus Electrothrix sp. ATG2]
MKLLLAGDVGRTVKLSLIAVQENVKTITKKDDLRILYENSYPMRSYALEDMIEKFLKEVPQKSDAPLDLSGACFAVPGPVVNNEMEFLTCIETLLGYSAVSIRNTNIDFQNFKKWKKLSATSLQENLKIPHVSLINDYESVCYGIHLLSISEESKEDLYLLKKGKISNNQSQVEDRIAALGVGTGLGKAFMLKKNDDTLKVCATEGGHTDFPPCSEEDSDLSESIKDSIQRTSSGRPSRISVEKVVSGHGIIDIYKFLREKKKYPESEKIKRELETYDREFKHALERNEALEQSVDPPAAIAQAAIFNKEDKLCTETMKKFLQILGAEAGNFVLKVLPYGRRCLAGEIGLYLAGGIVPKILPLLEEDDSFYQSFLNKGRMSDQLKDIPIYVVLNREVGLLGAAYCAAQLR